MNELIASCSDFPASGYIGIVVFIVIIVAIAIFEIVLKLMAMWKAAKKDELLWFVIIAIFNTAGILPLIYLLINRKSKSE